ncbi:AAA family ATPase [Phenylobacterium sp.]|uniref:AAA family ATPase n=1 Tax=Phenylobacterium sp. TaxID=1871053 RepID=UPI00356335AA
MLSLREVSTSGYRSLRAITYPVGGLEVFVGANGVGKTNLYRGLELLQAAAANRLGLVLAREGLRSAFWAGPRRQGSPARMKFAATLAGSSSATRFSYEIEVGFPAQPAGAFRGEPHVKSEVLVAIAGGRAVRLVDRQGASVMARGEDGRPVEVDIDLLASETVMGRLQDPSEYPAMDAVRRTLLEWRFYHDFRTDDASPIRRPCVAVASPTLASDGANLAAVFATLSEIRGDTADLDEVIANAFPGARLVIDRPDESATFGMSFAEFPRRVFAPAELSDGTLRFLALAGALMAYRLPPFIALNEPESSLHPDLMAPLADLIVRAGKRTQVWLVTHSERLAELVSRSDGAEIRRVLKKDGATWIDGLKLFGAYDDEEDD